MSVFIGIDLGTTNSAISTFDGVDVQVLKSPEQTDVTPSAIYVDRRTRYHGLRAYNMEPIAPDNVAVRFKRHMGTSTPIKLPAVSLVMKPEECSAEILKVLFGYLPEHVRNDPDVGTVITVPAAFNQMQKDATLAAAEMAGIGKVALMQEPVAAVMSIMRARDSDGTFLVYDLGGGTFDVAIAESVSRRVSLLEHGGIAMCGGRDFDRLVFDNLVKPWLVDNFDLPQGFMVDPRYARLVRIGTWAAEKAKIELSSRPEAVIQLGETELRMQDASGADMYLDIPITQKQFDKLIEERLMETVTATRAAIERAHLTTDAIDRIVFIGGPTRYKPVADRVCHELGISQGTQVDPMTAVASGAAIFSETVDWKSASRGRKSTRGSISASGGLNVRIEYVARTPMPSARVTVRLEGQAVPGSSFQIDSMDTGWSSGRHPLENGTRIDLTLPKLGTNLFRAFIFDASGGAVPFGDPVISIARTMASVDAIPASHSVGIEVIRKGDGKRSLRYLVRKGDPLPKKGTIEFQAAEQLEAGTSGALRFNIYEGEIEEPVTDNVFVGCMKIIGSDFDGGAITKDAPLVCDYEMLESGKLRLTVSVPMIGGTFGSDRDFYSRQEGEVDYTRKSKEISDVSEGLTQRLDQIEGQVNDPRTAEVRAKIEAAQRLATDPNDPESVKQADQSLQEAKEAFAKIRKANRQDILKADLASAAAFFEKHVKEHARPAETESFERLRAAAERAIAAGSNDFDQILDEMRGMNWTVLHRQDWFIRDRFLWLAERHASASDRTSFEQLLILGREAMLRDDFDELRRVVVAMGQLVRSGADDVELAVSGNIYG